MKFPSLSSLLVRAGRSFLRFPLTILLALLSTILLIVLVHSEAHEREILFIRCSNAVVSAYLGMLLSIAVTVWCETRQRGRKASFGLQAGVLALTVLYYFLMPDHFEETTVIRWVLYALGIHWLIAVIGFSGSERVNDFWQYNKNLFLRMLTSLLYTVVLYAGLALALEAIEHLFNVDIDYKWYLDVWLTLIGVFNTWFFLSGFPSDYNDAGTEYPKGLKIFTQYVLLPLLMVYMAILYAYLFKIVFTAHWPSGWVAYLVLGFSVAGILALLLIYPISNDEKNKWINGYSKFFYFALFPLLIMLGFAVGKRVGEYGITERRYFLLLLAVWLLLTAIYFLRSRKKNIRLIPFSLCILAFLSSFGPWSVFSVSRQSQQHRLKGLLVKNGGFKDGMVTSAQANIPFRDRREITSTTEYIVSTHGYESLQPWFKENLDSMMRRDSLTGRYEDRGRTEAILKLMHIPYTSHYDGENEMTYFNLTMDQHDIALRMEGQSYLLVLTNQYPISKDDSSISRYALGKDSVLLSMDSTLNQVHILSFTGMNAPAKDSVIIVDLRSVLGNMTDSTQYGLELPIEKMTVPFRHASWNGKLIIKEIDGVRRDKEVHVTKLDGYLLLGPAQ